MRRTWIGCRSEPKIGRTMRILIHGINFSPELTGIGKYTGEMAQWLRERGHEVRVVTAPPYYPEWRIGKGYAAWKYRRENRADGIVVYRCPLWVPAHRSGAKRLLHLFSFALSSFPLMLRQIFWHPDWVWVVEPPLFCAPGAWLTARLCGAKAWLHVQDFEVDAAFELGLLRSPLWQRTIQAAERFVLRRFDRVSTISHRMSARLAAKGVEADRRTLFPNWVNTERIRPLAPPPMELRRELGLADDTVVALYAGNMGQKQGLEIIIEAARLLESERRIQFVMCGEGTAREHLRSEAGGLRNIKWLSLQPAEHLNKLLNFADIHLLPQRPGVADLVMPSKLTGILASGRPVVATAAEDTELWSVVEGRGLNTPAGDAQAFADAIAALASRPERRAELGRAGRRYAEEYLGHTSVLERFETELR